MISWPRVLAGCSCAAMVAGAISSCGGAAFEAGSPDGGGPGPEDGGGSGTLDGGSSDGGPPGDAADGGGGAAEGGRDTGLSDGASSFTCGALDASTTLFCADFDHVATVGGGWTVTLAVNDGVNAFDTVDYRSPPNGYEATTPALTTKAAFAALQEQLTSSATALHLGFSLLMKNIDVTPNASATLASLDLSAFASPLTISVVMSGSTLLLQQTATAADGGTTTQSGSIGGIGTVAWTRVQIDVDRTVTPWTIEVRRDSVLKLSTTALTAPTDPSTQLSVGIVFVAPPSAGYGAAFDDVLLTE